MRPYIRSKFERKRDNNSDDRMKTVTGCGARSAKDVGTRYVKCYLCQKRRNVHVNFRKRQTDICGGSYGRGNGSVGRGFFLWRGSGGAWYNKVGFDLAHSKYRTSHPAADSQYHFISPSNTVGKGNWSTSHIVSCLNERRKGKCGYRTIETSFRRSSQKILTKKGLDSGAICNIVWDKEAFLNSRETSRQSVQ